VSRVLIVEDETHLATGLCFNLEAEGHDVKIASDGEAAIDLLLTKNVPFDAIVLDVMLPGKDGFASGADDYLPKPFELPILLARLQGLLRRSQWLQQAISPNVGPSEPESDLFSFNGRTIDFGKLELRVNGNITHLTAMEAQLLRYLIRNRGRVISRKQILEEVWDLQEDTDTRAIDNFIVRLRRYIEDDPSSPVYLLTARGVGYRFESEPVK